MYRCVAGWRLVVSGKGLVIGGCGFVCSLVFVALSCGVSVGIILCLLLVARLGICADGTLNRCTGSIIGCGNAFRGLHLEI